MAVARGALAVLLLIAAVAAVLACNSVVLDIRGPCPGDPEYKGGVVSASSFSETWGLAAGAWVLPKDSVTTMLEVAKGVPSLYGPTLTTKYNSICLSHSGQGIADNYGRDGSNLPEAWNICNQGMNDQGLTVSFQANTIQSVPAYNSDLGDNAVHYFDMPKVVLTQFKTVAEVEAAYDYQIVSDPQYTFFGESARTGSAQWLGIFDATGAAAVIEFVGGEGPRFVRNPLGVMANQPGFMADHIANFTKWCDDLGLEQDEESQLIVGPISTAELPGGGEGAEIDKGVFKNASAVPGGYDGDARFIRMAILKSAAYYKRCWPDPRRSPASAQTRRPGYPDLLPSMLTAKGIIDSVALPLGMTDFGQMGVIYEGTANDYYQDATYWETMRDHTNMLFYWRTFNNLAYRVFDLRRMSVDGDAHTAAKHGHGKHAHAKHGHGKHGKHGASTEAKFIPMEGLPNAGIVDITEDYLSKHA